jgi:hypothetical protein
MLGPKGARIMLGLPLSPFIQGLDMALVRGHSLLSTDTMTSRRGDDVVWSPWMLAYSVASAALVFGMGLLVFRRQSGRFAEMA